MAGDGDTLKVRLDKWLWAARFFKTRALAAEAVSGGKVHVNGQRVKPGRPVQRGDEMVIRRGFDEFTITVTALASRRGPASVAATLYEESAASVQAREARAAERRALAAQTVAPPRRPSKRDRRHIIRFTNKGH